MLLTVIRSAYAELIGPQYLVPSEVEAIDSVSGRGALPPPIWPARGYDARSLCGRVHAMGAVRQGSAKTVLSKLLRAMVDPNAAPVTALPREERELMIAAHNGHLLAFDNLSGLPAWLSDALCRLASGGKTEHNSPEVRHIPFATADRLWLSIMVKKSTALVDVTKMVDEALQFNPPLFTQPPSSSAVEVSGISVRVECARNTVRRIHSTLGAPVIHRAGCFFGPRSTSAPPGAARRTRPRRGWPDLSPFGGAGPR